MSTHESTESSTESTTDTTTVPATTPPPQVWPTLQATDAHALIDFLEEAFGFRRVVVYGDDDIVAHAQLAWPEGGGIMLGTAKTEGEWIREPGTFGAYVVTADPDAVHERARAAGARIIREPADQDYGNREVLIADPEGNLWSFGSYRGEPV